MHMSVTEITSEHSHSDNLKCSQCQTTLPKMAAFCDICGEHIEITSLPNSNEETLHLNKQEIYKALIEIIQEKVKQERSNNVRLDNEEKTSTTAQEEEHEEQSIDIAEMETLYLDKKEVQAAIEQASSEKAVVLEEEKDSQNFAFTERLKRQLGEKLVALPSSLLSALPRLPTPGSAQIFRQVEPAEIAASLMKKLQRFLIGVQQRRTTAVALIETPLGVQPNQLYTLRVHITGRNEPGLPEYAPPDTPLSGLSALAHGDLVHIEVRATLYQNRAYILQQTDVELPAQGYVAEVMIPMQTLSNGTTGRRERLYIYFMNQQRRPLYEKPFVVELFVSPLIRSGREGHNALPIPL
jgi:hypothetical protein